MQLKINQFNVGAGDHTLLEFADGKFALIDFHYGIEQKEPPAITYFKHLLQSNVKKNIEIAFVCITHYDSDHIRGLNLFLKWVEENKTVTIENILLPLFIDKRDITSISVESLKKYMKNKKQNDYDYFIENVASVNLYKKTLNQLYSFIEKNKKTKPNITVDYPTQGLINENISDFKLSCIAPMNEHINEFGRLALEDFFDELFHQKESSDSYRNLLSMVILLTYKSFSVLFCGDSTNEILTDSLKKIEKCCKSLNSEIKSIYVKAAHHGSENSSSEELWEMVTDEQSNFVIGFSAGLKYTHPHPETIRDLRQYVNRKQLNDKFRIFSTNTCAKCNLEQCDDCIIEFCKDIEKDENFLNQDYWFKKEEFDANRLAMKNIEETHQAVEKLVNDDVGAESNKFDTSIALSKLEHKESINDLYSYILSHIVEISENSTKNIFHKVGTTALPKDLELLKRVSTCVFSKKRNHNIRISDLKDKVNITPHN